MSQSLSIRPVIRKAERRKSKLRLALCGPSGSGKTMSALLLAFGLGGKVGVIDTEHASADLYADLGDYDVISLAPPFSVHHYREAIRAFEDAGYDTIIVDSLSHAWSGEGGLLDRQGQLEASGKYRNSFATWREITPDHNKLVEQMLGSPTHIIATMRSKMEWVVEKDDRGKSTVRKVGLAPVQRDGITFEFTVVMDVAENHTATATKDRTALLDGWCDRISRQTGQMLRQWLERGSSAAPAPVESTPRSVGAAAASDNLVDLDEPAVPRTRNGNGKPSTREWLNALDAQLAVCETRDEAEALILSDQVCAAARTLTGVARDRLKTIMDNALARFEA
ncbi:MAG TPA: ATP-binding protein [Ktedonobacterales bacterium]|nr:ATP-binding protein [Ktedonobacterales bacterium]